MEHDPRTIEAEIDPPRTRTGLVLVAGASACLVAAGLLLWSDRGGAVFSDMVLTALAWCF